MEQPALFADAFSKGTKARSPHHLAVEGWHQLWRETRGEDWAWSPVDHARIRDTLKFRSGGDPAVLVERARLLLTAAPSAWLAQNASPGVLYSHWHSLTAKVRPTTRDERNLASLRAAMEAL